MSFRIKLLGHINLVPMADHMHSDSLLLVIHCVDNSIISNAQLVHASELFMEWLVPDELCILSGPSYLLEDMLSLGTI
jgi:hypothetical protein